MITWDTISDDEVLGRSLLRYATTVAPCLPKLVNEELILDAVAILNRAAKELSGRPDRHVKTRIRGPWNTTYFSPAQVGAAISDDDRAALQSICQEVCGDAGRPRGPVGHFPPPSPALGRLWPEQQ